MTGITMFSNINLFSGANIFEEMTLRNEISGAYGFTESEIINFFKDKFSGDYCNIEKTMTKPRERWLLLGWSDQSV
jgi:hypothetical protein